MRKDGKRVRDINPMYSVVPHIMAERSDSLNYITVKLPYKPIHEYMNLCRKNGHPVSHMALLLTAYLRVVAQNPELNRFVVNKKVYAHNDFKVALVVLKPGSESEATMGKVEFSLYDTLFDVNRKINEYVTTNRKASEENGMDRVAGTLVRIPGLLRFGVALLKFLDKHALMPRAVIDASPFHSSLTISNLASIRTKEIYHHIYNFGTTSVFITMGTPEKNLELVGGVPTEVRYIPLGVVMDERVGSGLLFAHAFRKFASYLEHPELLEAKPETVILDSPFLPKKKSRACGAV